MTIPNRNQDRFVGPPVWWRGVPVILTWCVFHAVRVVSRSRSGSLPKHPFGRRLPEHACPERWTGRPGDTRALLLPFLSAGAGYPRVGSCCGAPAATFCRLLGLFLSRCLCVRKQESTYNMLSQRGGSCRYVCRIIFFYFFSLYLHIYSIYTSYICMY